MHDESRDDMDLTDTMSQELEATDEDQDAREPTFSSEASSQHPSSQSPRGLSVAFSSPAPSVMFTPTPAFQPRPRARFATGPALVTPQPLYRVIPEEEDDLATPSAHKRTFLMSVINSRTRPRITHTPHPQRGGNGVPPPATPSVNLQSAFAGVTPRPRAQLRPRIAQPSPQPSAAPSESGSASGAESPGDTQTAASGSESPYDGNADRMSFISTASSQDLTTHARANASFDPVMGLGERGHGVGRFNAGKLNNYLHGLNRRLQEENETLVLRLKTYEEKYVNPALAEQPSVAATPQMSDRSVSSRWSSAGRRVSAGPSMGLGDVPEEGAEAWLEEKAALQDEIDEIKQELQRYIASQQEAEQALEQEKTKRARDRQDFEQRVLDVNQKVSDVVQGLEDRLADSEQRLQAAERSGAAKLKDLEQQIETLVAENDFLEDRAKKAESALKGGRELGSELNVANERITQLSSDLRNAQQQMKELEIEVMTSDSKIDDLESKLQREREARSAQEDDLRAKKSQLDDALVHADKLTEELHKAQQDLRAAEAYVAQMDSDAEVAVERIEVLEAQLAAADERWTAMEGEAEQDEFEIQRLSDEAKQAAELGRQMQQALEAAESRIVAKEEEIASLQAALASAERTAERERERSQSKSAIAQSDSSQELRADVEALEEELMAAHKEIARLKTAISQSPARKAIDKAKDVKIDLLEREKADLLERLKLNKGNHSLHATPIKTANGSGFSPLHRQLLSLKSPKTPGGPLRDVSWTVLPYRL